MHLLFSLPPAHPPHTVYGIKNLAFRSSKHITYVRTYVQVWPDINFTRRQSVSPPTYRLVQQTAAGVYSLRVHPTPVRTRRNQKWPSFRFQDGGRPSRQSCDEDTYHLPSIGRLPTRRLGAPRRFGGLADGHLIRLIATLRKRARTPFFGYTRKTDVSLHLLRVSP